VKSCTVTIPDHYCDDFGSADVVTSGVTDVNTCISECEGDVSCKKGYHDSTDACFLFYDDSACATYTQHPTVTADIFTCT
jgi:hypothetical protein